jgi:hypothetical protein
MKRLIAPIAIFLLLLGAFNCYFSWRFLRSAQSLTAVVTEVKEHRGPPKPRQRTPVTLAYRNAEGVAVRASANLPLLTVIKEGDQIPILVDPESPEEARLPLWSEIWAKPFTYIIAGILLGLTKVVLSLKRFR